MLSDGFGNGFSGVDVDDEYSHGFFRIVASIWVGREGFSSVRALDGNWLAGHIFEAGRAVGDYVLDRSAEACADEPGERGHRVQGGSELDGAIGLRTAEDDLGVRDQRLIAGRRGNRVAARRQVVVVDGERNDRRGGFRSCLPRIRLRIVV